MKFGELTPRGRRPLPKQNQKELFLRYSTTSASCKLSSFVSMKSKTEEIIIKAYKVLLA